MSGPQWNSTIPASNNSDPDTGVSGGRVMSHTDFAEEKSPSLLGLLSES